ncbi:MAG: ABC transporter permease [Lachnospiraceae bacterium]|nr:ABC transporter permease [Lachnospiraceae bacterium]
MRTATVKALYKRELLDIFRDKKTVVMMVALPILLYPALIIAMVLIINAVTASQAEKEYTVYMDLDQEADTAIRGFAALDEKDEDALDYKLQFLSMDQVTEKLAENDTENEQAKDGEEEADPLKRALTDKVLNAYVTGNKENGYEIHYLSAKTDSNIAKNALKQAFDLYEEDLREETVKAAGLEVKAILEPIDVSLQDISSKEESVGSQIGSLLPFFIITSVLMGALYPSIDVTAGEKERGTLETLLTLPITNLEMLLSKFFAVATISCISAFLNIFSMGGAMLFLVSGAIASAEDLNVSLDYKVFLPGIGFTLIVMLFFAMLVTAVCMCTCIFAKSFKEANNYATPVMLVFMFGGYATLLPNLELTAKSAVLPIVNVALMIKSLFGFSADYGLFAMVLASNMAYSLLAILVLSRLYNSEAVLFSEGFTSVRLFAKRSEMKKGQMPGGGDVVIVMTSTILLMLYLGTFAVAKLGFYGVAVQQAMILLVPVLYAWYIKADAKKLFSLRMPHPLSWIGALLMVVGAFVLAMFLGAILAPLFPESAQNVNDLSEFLSTAGKIPTVLVIALMPAAGEELLFRGFFMGTLREKAKPVTVIALTAIFFAAYHMSLLRFFTVGVIGLSFTVAAYKSRSIFLSMLMHFCNNLTAVITSWYPDKTEKLLDLDPKVLESPLTLFALLSAALGAVVVGYLLVRPAEEKQAAEPVA